jgi:hypothetical protein
MFCLYILKVFSDNYSKFVGLSGMNAFDNIQIHVTQRHHHHNKVDKVLSNNDLFRMYLLICKVPLIRDRKSILDEWDEIEEDNEDEHDDEESCGTSDSQKDDDEENSPISVSRSDNSPVKVMFSPTNAANTSTTNNVISSPNTPSSISQSNTTAINDTPTSTSSQSTPVRRGSIVKMAGSRSLVG